MKKILLITFILLSSINYSQVLMSWNIQNLGQSKFKKKEVLKAIANVMLESKADIISVQEVVTSSYGDSCILYISKILGYNYVISEKTSGDGSEKYAFIYKPHIKLDKAYLEESLADSINREPFVGHFTIDHKSLIIRQVHLVPTSKNPQYEVSKLYYYKNKEGIICGDFNLTDKHLIFIPLLINFNSPLSGTPTTLKNSGDVSGNSYDHFLVSKNIKVINEAVFLYDSNISRKQLSDHLPILVVLQR